MEKQQQLSIVLLCTMLAFLSSVNSLSFISDEALQTRFPTGRILLQAERADCPVDFGKADYTILTSKCKGPKYPAGPCCSAFKEFACPYADLLNDLSNNCATSMFNYIRQYYPPGIFVNECRDSERGLECPESPSPAPSPAAL